MRSHLCTGFYLLRDGHPVWRQIRGSGRLLLTPEAVQVLGRGVLQEPKGEATVALAAFPLPTRLCFHWPVQLLYLLRGWLPAQCPLQKAASLESVTWGQLREVPSTPLDCGKLGWSRQGSHPRGKGSCGSKHQEVCFPLPKLLCGCNPPSVAPLMETDLRSR